MKKTHSLVIGVALGSFALIGCSDNSAGNPTPPDPKKHAQDIQNNPNIPPQAKAAFSQFTQGQKPGQATK